MSQQQDDPYLNTTARLEPEIAMIDRDAALASIAISLKRLADNSDRQIDILADVARATWSSS